MFFGLFRNKDKVIKDILDRDERMEKYYLQKAIEYSKYAATNIDIDAMVVKFKDNQIGEHDSATINKIVDERAKYYRQGIEDTLKKIRGQK